LAGFEVTTIGRFWVTAEGLRKEEKKPRVWTGFWHEYVVVDGEDKRN